MNKGIVLIWVFLFVLMSFTSISGIQVNNQNVKDSGRSNILYVGGSGPGNYSSIQDAINDAFNGDIIQVYSGIYHENIVVNKMLKLIGNGSTKSIIDGNYVDHKHVVSITANGVEISGFGLRNSYMGHEYGGFGIYSSSNKIYNNNCWNNLYGAILFSGNNMIFNNSFSDNKRTGIFIKSSGNIIDNNDCCNSSESDGIWLYICDNNIISNNTCLNNDKNGICLYQSQNNEIINNICQNNNLYDGILIYESSNNIINDNNLLSNNDDGIGISYYSNNNTIIDNYILNNNCGIEVELYSNNNTVKENIIYSNNGYGVRISYPDNYIFHNNFENNNLNAFDQCDSNSWDNGYPSGGNYWDDYTGEDNNGDGIGDTPYPIPGGDNEDRYPLMEPWSGNRPPDVPIIIGYENESLYFYSIDPDSDDVKYFIDWDDGTVDETSWYPSGQIVEMNHSWFEGVYHVKVKAMDIYGAESYWSDSYTIKIGHQLPSIPIIYGPTHGKVGVEYIYTFNSTDYKGDYCVCIVNWGDGSTNETVHPSGPNGSDPGIANHSWDTKGTYVIGARATDEYGAYSDWGTLTVTMPRDKVVNNWLVWRLLERFPILQKLLQQLGFEIYNN